MGGKLAVTVGPRERRREISAGRFGKGKAEIVVLDRDHRTWLAVSIPKEYISTWTTVVGFEGTTLVTYSTSGRLRFFKPE
jgi:hypothetical protein